MFIILSWNGFEFWSLNNFQPIIFMTVRVKYQKLMGHKGYMAWNLKNNHLN